MKKEFKIALKQNKNKLPLSFSFIKIDSTGKKKGGKIMESEFHQTEKLRLDPFYKSLNIDVPYEI